jgi:hypothetical protein
LDFHPNEEAPTIYHRWASIVAIGTLLGRNAFVIHGHNKLFGNQYVMLVGESGARKDSAIRPIKSLLREAGYNYIAANKSSKEQFLADLDNGMDNIDKDEDDKLDVTKNVRNKSFIWEGEFFRTCGMYNCHRRT